MAKISIINVSQMDKYFEFVKLTDLRDQKLEAAKLHKKQYNLAVAEAEAAQKKLDELPNFFVNNGGS